MPLDPTAFVQTPAPGRDCGTCTLCCKVYDVPVLDKPRGQWCRHCLPGKGCGIHDTRPEHCRVFFCLWMTDGSFPEHWKPERSKIVLTIFPENGFLYGQVDPGTPRAFEKEPYAGELKRFAADLLKQNRHVIMFVNDQATLILPDQTVPMGRMGPRDLFRLERVFRDGRASYDVVRLARA